MRHQRPSSAKRAAVSFQACGRSTTGRSYFGARLQAAMKAKRLLVSMRRMVRGQRSLVGHFLRVADLVLDLARRALLGEMPVGHQLEEHRHEEDGEAGRAEHAAHHPGAGGV